MIIENNKPEKERINLTKLNKKQQLLLIQYQQTLLIQRLKEKMIENLTI